MVANTHLLFNPRRGDIKLAQLIILLAELDHCAAIQLTNPVSRSQDRSLKDYCPVVICGDFNMVPYCELYRFLITGHLHYRGQLLREMSGQEEAAHGRDCSLMGDFFSPSYGISTQCQYHCSGFRQPPPGPNCQSRTELELPGLPTTTSTCTNSTTLTPSVTTVGVGQEERQSAGCYDKSNTAVGQSPHGTIHGESEPSMVNSVTSSSSLTETRPGSDEQAHWSDTGGNCPVVENEQSCARSMRQSHQQPTVLGNWAPDSSYNRQQDAIHTEEGNNVMKDGDVSSPHHLSHLLNLVSAYRHTIQHLRQTAEVTSHHSRTSTTLDYIFYSVMDKRVNWHDHMVDVRDISEGKLVLLARYGLMSGPELNELGGIPNRFLPSDHLCLIAQFLLK